MSKKAWQMVMGFKRTKEQQNQLNGVQGTTKYVVFDLVSSKPNTQHFHAQITNLGYSNRIILVDYQFKKEQSQRF